MTGRMTAGIGRLFRKNLLDLVKGIRSNKGNESQYINQCLSDIKAELYMMGYDISFAHFNVVEVMSQPCFAHKRIAYLVASISFTQETDVILLTVHSFKKVFQNKCGTNAALAEGQKYEAGCAINCLANICTPYLAETLLEDIYAMMISTKPYLRKKAVLVLYAIFRKYPKALPLSFERLKNKLKDEDAGVQNAAVNVVCELARKNPSNYLALLPQLFDLLNNSNNNWMLIKLVKLLGSLIPAEPRLCKKLQEPLTHIITNTPAKSLLYECINTVTSAPSIHKSMIRLCLDKLRTFVEDPDQNLKYLGLLGLNKVMDTNIKAVAQHKDLILQCLDDPDPTIRMRSLDLITSMVNERNLEAIIHRLTDHLYGTDGNYRDHVLEQIINVCKKHDYEYVRDFAWYVQLLTNMTGLSSMCKRNAEIVSSQLMDVTIRVPAVRQFSVLKMEEIIINGLISDSHNMQSNAICRVLEASAYIVGEYSLYVTSHLTLVKAMLQSRIASLPGDIQCIFIHNALKVICSGLQVDDDDDDDSVELCLDLISGTIQLLRPFALSSFVEVQERANSYLFFVEWLKSEFIEHSVERSDLIFAFEQAFVCELMPVRPQSQEMVARKIPKGIDLDEWMGEQWINSADDESDGSDDSWDLHSNHSQSSDQSSSATENEWFLGASKPKHKHKHKKMSKAQKEEMNRTTAARKSMQKCSPWYIGNDEQKIDDDDDSDGDGHHHHHKHHKHKHKKKKKKDDHEITIDSAKPGIRVFPQKSSNHKRKKKYIVLNTTAKKEKKSKKKKKEVIDPLSLDIDLTVPCTDEMPGIKPYIRNNEFILPSEQTNNNDNNDDVVKKLNKREKKKLKKQAKKQKKAEKRAKKKKNKKVVKKKSNETVVVENMNILGDLDFDQNSGEFDLLENIFSNIENKPKIENKIEMKEEQKEQKKLKKKHKNGKKNGFIPDVSSTKQTFYSDSNLMVEYNICPIKSKHSNMMSITLFIHNTCKYTLHSIYVSFTKSKMFKISNSHKIKIAKKLKSDDDICHTFQVKCKEYQGKDEWKCKISYEMNKKVINKSLTMALPTHAFFIHTNEDIDEQLFLDFVQECIEKSCLQLKLKNRTLDEMLDMLVKIWRVRVVVHDHKTHAYYAQLLLEKKIAIYVKLSKNKKALQITVKCSEQSFADAVVEELEAVFSL